MGMYKKEDPGMSSILEIKDSETNCRANTTSSDLNIIDMQN